MRVMDTMWNRSSLHVYMKGILVHDRVIHAPTAVAIAVAPTAGPALAPRTTTTTTTPPAATADRTTEARTEYT